MNTKNLCEDEITLAPQTEIFEEAKKIAEKTSEDEKFPFALYYDANQKDFLLSVLQAVGAEVEADDEEGHTLATRMNMTQLKLIKSLDCVERVRTDEGTNTFITNEVDATSAVEVANEPAVATQSSQIMTLATEEPIAVASADIAVASVSNCTPNADMASAETVPIGVPVSGCICCPGAAQWFKFTPTQSGTYTIYTLGSLDTVGALYDCNGNLIAEVDDYAPCGKLNFRIIQPLQANTTYYVRVTEAKSDTGNYSLKVTQKTLVNYVRVTPSKIVLEEGKTYELPTIPNTYVNPDANIISDLSVSVFPANADEQRVIWSETGHDVIRTEMGWFNGQQYQTVKAVGKGMAKLSAFDMNSDGKFGECTVYVGGYPVTGLTLDCTTKTMNVGDSVYLLEFVSPLNALNRNVIWNSSDTSIAEVDLAGKVTANDVGTAIITARTEDGDFTETCTIHVVNGIVIEKYPDADHSRIVFPNGKVWNCINFDIINDYILNMNDSESQRFYDNVYERKVVDEDMKHTFYYPPFKEYTDEELKVLYMIDPHGMAAYVREYASALPDSGDGVQTMLSKILAYKDRIFSMLFNRAPDYYARTIDGQWYVTSSRSDLTDLLSESESLFGIHSIYDMVTFRQCLTVLVDLISMGIQCPALSQFKFVGETLPMLLKYFSLARSVSESVLSADFNGFLNAIISGVIDEEELDETIVLPDKEFKAANYNMGWAFEMLSLSSDLGALADTFNAGPHFYKEVFTKCLNDSDYDVYMRMADGNLVSVSNLTNVID